MTEKLCTVEGCATPENYYCKGLCRSHYERVRRNGTTDYHTPKQCLVEDCQRQARARGMCQKHYSLWWYHNRHLTNKTGQTGGRRLEQPGYMAAHDRVRSDKGFPKEHQCVECGETAEEWALSAEAGAVLRGLAHAQRHKGTKYSLNPDDYLAMCKPCHRAYDARTGNRNYKTGQYAKYDGTKVVGA